MYIQFSNFFDEKSQNLFGASNEMLQLYVRTFKFAGRSSIKEVCFWYTDSFAHQTPKNSIQYML